MVGTYLVHLPDGTRYGPIDRTTLEGWHREGRLPADTLVWPEGAPQWQSVEDALSATDPAIGEPAGAKPGAVAKTAVGRPASSPAGAPRPAATPRSARPVATPHAATPATPGTPVKRRLADHRSSLQPHADPAPRAVDARRAANAAFLRKLLLLGTGVVLVAAVLAGLLVALRPFVARRWAVASIERQALLERHLEQADSGLVVDLPAGWVALRKDSPLVTVQDARLRLAQPELGAFAAITVTSRPRFVDQIDAHLDDVLQQRLPLRPETRELGRSDVQLGRGRGRLVRTTFREGLREMTAATVAWADGYQMLSLEAWAPAEARAEFATEVEALCRGLRSTGRLDTRVAQAVDGLALQVPELSPDSLRLLVAEQMSQGRGVEGVPAAALFMVSRGLDVLSPAEAQEMDVIYRQVWEPVPEAERVRLNALLQAIRAGRPVRAEDVQSLREVVKNGVLALAPEQRTRLQQLSGRAVRRAFSRP